MKISIIIPVFNEGSSLEELYRQITDSIKIYNEYEIIFIDDGSSDESKKIIKKMIEQDHKVKLISFYRNLVNLLLFLRVSNMLQVMLL